MFEFEFDDYRDEIEMWGSETWIFKEMDEFWEEGWNDELRWRKEKE